MANFLNEQEQVELIQNIWKKYGLASLSALIIAIVALSGFQYWQTRMQNMLNAASVNYQYLLQESQQGNTDVALKLANALVVQYPKTPYAGMAYLFLAQQNIVDKDLQKADQNLTFAIDHLKSPLNSVAILRLARIKIAENQTAQAIDLLSTHDMPGFEPQSLMLQGDAYLAQKNNAKAVQAYQAALAAFDKNADFISQKIGLETDEQKTSDLKSLIQLKLNALNALNPAQSSLR
jgi:predicted negative regulator of RcsB-dependent stress response